jgi:hypothetical protein
MIAKNLSEEIPASLAKEILIANVRRFSMEEKEEKKFHILNADILRKIEEKEKAGAWSLTNTLTYKESMMKYSDIVNHDTGQTLAGKLAKQGSLPKEFNDWEMPGTNSNGDGWKVAHVAAQYDNLPKNFNAWEIKNNNGVSVADVAMTCNTCKHLNIPKQNFNERINIEFRTAREKHEAFVKSQGWKFDHDKIDFKTCRELLKKNNRVDIEKALKKYSPGLAGRHKDVDSYVKKTVDSAYEKNLTTANKKIKSKVADKEKLKHKDYVNVVGETIKPGDHTFKVKNIHLDFLLAQKEHEALVKSKGLKIDHDKTDLKVCKDLLRDNKRVKVERALKDVNFNLLKRHKDVDKYVKETVNSAHTAVRLENRETRNRDKKTSHGLSM